MEDETSFESMPSPLSNFATWTMVVCVICAWSVPLLAIHGSPVSQVAGEAEAPATYSAYGWRMEWSEKYWLMHVDIPHGLPTAHMKIGVVVDFVTNRPTAVFLHVPNDADAEAGLQVAFPARRSGGRQVDLPPLDLGFEECDEDWCVVVLRDAGPASGRATMLSLMNRLLSEESVRISYSRQGERTMARLSLLPFRLAYQGLLKGDSSRG